ncbi:hypothetical protein JQC91_08425 [Jannaschia sp. Os4]|uniref:DUF6544 family protein n=1 Tax=Jannaschia sp. Os4 TaxID=2807617 RepID=UPI00193A4D71|nr:DUF6544 family protein [Jannaschia sp. Os4]MBM2576330.1 hypothetical protein [Jannaschia sp. Os4]
MRRAVPLLASLALAGGGALLAWRASDRRADRAEAARLRARQPRLPSRFDPAMVDGLPEPARRFLRAAIAPGTPLRPVAEIEMAGTFAMGDGAAPKILAMRATQTHAAPHGFVWAMRARGGPYVLSGSDSATWTRFWMGGVVPVARRGGDADHARAAFGRMVAEAAIWTPAAVLPGPSVEWSAPAPDVARVTMRAGALSQSVDLALSAAGRPRRVTFRRWTDANPERVWRHQPFGATLSAFRTFGGVTVPTHVEAANMFGTPEHFTFFVADVTALRFPPD